MQTETPAPIGDWQSLAEGGRIALAIGLGWEGVPSIEDADAWISDVLKIRERVALH
jgi:hypothetical protein